MTMLCTLEHLAVCESVEAGCSPDLQGACLMWLPHLLTHRLQQATQLDSS